eukprot:scaffold577107_cov17-Prasinocladus_malaysianus.AAC.1
MTPGKQVLKRTTIDNSLFSHWPCSSTRSISCRREMTAGWMEPRPAPLNRHAIMPSAQQIVDILSYTTIHHGQLHYD